MNKILILLTLTLSLLAMTTYAKVKKDPRDLIKTEVDSFFGEDNYNTMVPVDELKLKKAIFENNSCLKFLKEGERFWTIYETLTLKIVDIGKKNLKIQKYAFMNNKKWIILEPEAMEFDLQKQFMQVECPSLENKLTNEEILDLKKKNKLKNIK